MILTIHITDTQWVVTRKNFPKSGIKKPLSAKGTIFPVLLNHVRKFYNVTNE